jgi:hypothetical protein
MSTKIFHGGQSTRAFVGSDDASFVHAPVKHTTDDDHPATCTEQRPKNLPIVLVASGHQRKRLRGNINMS